MHIIGKSHVSNFASCVSKQNLNSTTKHYFHVGMKHETHIFNFQKPSETKPGLFFILCRIFYNSFTSWFLPPLNDYDNIFGVEGNFGYPATLSLSQILFHQFIVKIVCMVCINFEPLSV